MNRPSRNISPTEGRHRSLLWGTSWTTLYQMVSFAVKIARGLIIPRFLAPVGYGLWSSLSVVVGYTRYADLGVQQQMAKRLPYKLGKEGLAGYWDLAGRGIIWTICVTVAVCTMLVGYSFLYQGTDAWFYRPAFRLLALVIVAQNARLLLTTMVVARQEFRLVAINGSLTEALGVIAAVVGLLFIGIMGLIWAFLFAELVGALHFLYHLRGYGMPRMQWHLSGVSLLIKEGLLLLGVALLEQVMMTVDQLFILRFFTKEQFGIYSLGFFIAAALITISAIFLTAQPRILELGGSGQQEQSRQIIETNVALCILVSAICVGLFLPVIDFTVHFYLKKYAAGLPVFVLMQSLALARVPVMLLRSHFLVHNREKRLIAFQLCGLMLAVLLDILGILFGWGMAYILLASTAGYLLTSALMFLQFEKGRRIVGHAKYVMLLASIAGVLLLFYFYQYREFQSNSVRYILETFGASLAYIVMIAGVAMISWRSWLSDIRSYIGNAKIPLLSRLMSWGSSLGWQTS